MPEKSAPDDKHESAGRWSSEPSVQVHLAGADGTTFLDAATYQLQFTSFEHRWECHAFNRCTTWYSVQAFVKNTATGDKVNCSVVETNCWNHKEEIPDDYGDPQWYKHFDDVTDFAIGFGQKDGHDPDFWGLAVCYLPGGQGKLVFKWHTWC